MKTIGLDFGTESCRGVLVDVDTGKELRTAVSEYQHGVINGKYQNADDYVSSMKAVLKEIGKADAIGVDATACSVLPCRADGSPLSRTSKNPHALVKLWKNHDAQPQADRVNETAAKRNEKWFARYGKVSSEWFHPKVLLTLEEAPDIYNEADRFIEKGDWIVWQLTGRESRNSCAAGYKAMWHKKDGYPSKEFFDALNPKFANVVDEKMACKVTPVGSKIGEYNGMPVAAATIDAHAALPAAGINETGVMLLVMGTSLCHMLLGDKEAQVEGMCGVVEDGIMPGFFGYESGQSAVGDMFAWFTREFDVPHEASDKPSRLVALDWMNGSRELQNSDLSGMIMGLTLDTKPAEIYRALVESAAFGTRRIIEAYEMSGVPVKEFRACGGLPEKNPFLMQVFADVTGRPIRIARSAQTSAVGSAMFAAMAAGANPENMGGTREMLYEPNDKNHNDYERLYAIYQDLHAKFSDGEQMLSLRRTS